MNKKSFCLLLAFCLMLAFVFGIFYIFQLRFTRGDFFPKYSSYRSDPLGCKVLFESYNQINGLKVSRLNRPLNEISNPTNSVLFYTGVTSFSNEIGYNKKLYNYIYSGGRALVFFTPDYAVRKSYFFDFLTNDTEKAECEVIKSNDVESISLSSETNSVKTNETIFVNWVSDENITKTNKTVKIIKTEKIDWKVSVVTSNTFFNNEDFAKPTEDFSNLFSSLTIFSKIYFETHSNNWKILFTRNNFPIIVEKKLGKGSVIFAATSFFISNEGLKKSKKSDFFCYMIQERKNIIFDEYKHGISEERNIIWLMQKYNLSIFAGNIFLIIALILWKNAASINNITQKYAHKTSSTEIEFSNSKGLENLLRKTVPTKELHKECLREWEKTVQNQHIDENKIKQAKKFIDIEAENKKSSVEIYNLINDNLI